MKKLNKYFCLLLVLGVFLPISGKLAAEDYTKMSKVELDSAFVLAVKNQNSEKIQELVQAGASANTPIDYIWTAGDCDWDIKSTPLIYAVRHNSIGVIKALLKVDKSLNQALNEALDEAIKHGYPSVVAELIEGGANINYIDINKEKDTPLIKAVSAARATSEFSLQAQDKFMSRWSQRREIIQILLEKKAKVGYANNYGRTALMEAVREHDLNTVQKLLQVPEMTTTSSYFGSGKKPINYADQDGNTALILAIQNVRYRYIGDQEYKICVNSQKIIKTLLETPGIDSKHANKNGETAATLLEKLSKLAGS